MATKIIPKKSSVVNKVPLATDLEVGEVAINLADRLLYSKQASGTVIQLAGTPYDQSLNTTDSVTFTDVTTPSLQITGGTGAEGTLTWNTDDQTLNLDVGNGVVYQFGQEVGQTVRNLSGVTIANGAVVRVTGASGAKATVDLASNTGEAASSSTFAVATEVISNNSTGRVTTDGYVRGLDTTAFAEGAAIWLGSNGTFTTTKPASPAHLVHVGWIIRSHATEGTILVKISNGWELEELHDVLITDIAVGELLQWNGSLWVNQTVTELADELLTSIKTVDGASSGLDADLLDGQHGSYYLDANNFVNMPSGGGLSYTKKTANYTAVANEGIIADTTTASFTVTLPATPSLGDVVVIADGGNWAANNLTVGRNGSTIDGDAEDMTLDLGGVFVQFIYDGTTWQVYAQAGITSTTTSGGGTATVGFEQNFLLMGA